MTTCRKGPTERGRKCGRGGAFLLAEKGSWTPPTLREKRRILTYRRPAQTLRSL